MRPLETFYNAFQYRNAGVPKCGSLEVQKLRRTEILKEMKDQIKSIKEANRLFPTAIPLSTHLHFYEASLPYYVSS